MWPDLVRPSLRILVVEDEFLVAIVLEEDLKTFGIDVVGPYSSLEAATEAARNEAYDLAILDVNLNGTMVYPLAEELIERGKPFLFLSGYESVHLPERLRTVPRLAKPYYPRALVGLISELVRHPRGSGLA